MNYHKPNVLIFTGAGLSAPSGIPTFRGAGGTWHDHDIDQVCDITTYKKNFELVHEFYNARRADAAQAIPNAAHEQIASWQHTYGDAVTIFTQNVDLLLEQAGCVNVHHVHGRLDHMECTECGHEWPVGVQPWNPHTDTCVNCGSRDGVKPATVFFNQHAPMYKTLYWAIKQIHDRTLVIIMGTSGVVIDVQTLFGHTPAVKVLNNLKPEPAIRSDLFDHVFYESAHEAVHKIAPLVHAHMNAQA